tara:strand:- start:1407 stop:1772 length:366 start_codon:yes stop_codon:yes gene_type:complete
MPKARELTDVEKFYIENNLGKTNEQLSSQMPGVGAKTVGKYRESIPQTKDTDHVTETKEQRINRLGSGPKSGEFISKRDGVAIMTSEASEVSDARKIVQGQSMSAEKYQEVNKDKIHRPQD